MFGGPWRVPMLDGPWKVPMFGGQWKVPMFSGPWKVPMFDDQWKEKEKHLFHLFSLPPNKFYLNLFFCIDLNVLLYHGSRPLLTPFFFFPWPINYNHALDVTSLPHIHHRFDWRLKIFSFPWIHGVEYDHVLRALSCTSEWGATSGVIPKFDIDARKILNYKRCALVSKLNPLKLGVCF
jgi:hypothetical protein